ncbi:MAG: hypothetical protein Q9185_003797 [Variospora sp. 1 TL-2023]
MRSRTLPWDDLMNRPCVASDEQEDEPTKVTDCTNYTMQPDSEYVHSEGPIQKVEGQPRRHTLNPNSLVTLQTIARLVMKAFVGGLGAGDAIPRSAGWSCKTDDPNFARRIITVMTDMGALGKI